MSLNTSINVIKRDGTNELFNIEKIERQLIRACEGIEDVEYKDILEDVVKQLYDGTTTKEIDSALTLNARSRIEYEPNYSYVAGRLLLYQIYKEVLGKVELGNKDFETIYRTSFIFKVKELIREGKYDPRLIDFNLVTLALSLSPELDYKFKYLGLQTLYDRYLLKHNGKCVELPQWFWMRVCMGVCINEKKEDKHEYTRKFYDMVSNFRACFSSPTLFNSGTPFNQLCSCYLSTSSDSGDDIMGSMHSQALLSKFAGGLGLSITPIRASGSTIKTSGGKAAGPINYIKIFNDVLVAYNQGGRRLGAGCIYMEPWHLDIYDFLNLRKNIGDERKLARDTNTALWIPDLFMERVENNGYWHLFCPSEVPDLHELYGDKFKERYEQYENEVGGKITRYRKIKAKDLMREIINYLAETGHPWICFKDAANIRYTDKHEGIIHSSNLCCVAGDQRAVTDKGILTVRELEQLDCANIVVGRDKFYNATKIVKTLKCQKICEIATQEGYSHKVTLDHPVWVKNRGWVEAQNLNISDLIEIQQIKGLFGIEKPLLSDLINHIDNQSIPDIIWKSDEDTIRAYTNYIINKYDNISNNFKFLQDLQILSTNLGFTGEIYKYVGKPSSIYYQLIYKSLKYATVSEIRELEYYEDVYCLKVNSLDHAWTCNGLITKNTEYLRHTKPSIYNRAVRKTLGEIAVCDLSSTNLSEHLDAEGHINWQQLAETRRLQVRAGDNIIDLNYYPVDEAAESNNKHRPFGLGLMGWQDLLHLKGISYESEEAAKLASDISEFLSYATIDESINLAAERGTYSTYSGSSWSQGKLPIDLYYEHCKYRGQEASHDEHLSWASLRHKLLKYGIRNASLMCIAPTACVKEDTLILCSEGLLPIKSIYKDNNEVWNNIDISVIQDDNITKATKLYNNGISDVITFETVRGHTISCTENHRLRVIDESGKYVWKYAKDISTSDLLARKIGGHEALLKDKEYVSLITDYSNMHYNENKNIKLPEKVDERFAEWIGYFMGDGCINNRVIRTIIGDKDLDLVEYFTKYINELGINPIIELSKGCRILNAFSRRLHTFFHTNNLVKPKGTHGEGAEGAFVPEQVLRSRSSVICAFIRGLFEAEGSVTFNSGKTPTINCSSVSKKLLSTVHILLESLGIKCRLRKQKHGTFGKRDVYILEPMNIDNAIKFMAKIGFISNRKNRLFKEYSSNIKGMTCKGEYTKNKAIIKAFYDLSFDNVSPKDRQKIRARIQDGKTNNSFIIELCNKYPYMKSSLLYDLLCNKNLDLIEIRSITKEKDVNTYDLSVPSNNTYIANSFISHNTISFIQGCSPSMEADYGMLFVYSTLSGHFTCINDILVNKLKRLNLWTKEIYNAIKLNNGDISNIEVIPQDIKDQYKTVFTYDFKKLIDCCAAAQKWIDMGISWNIYYNGKSQKEIYDIYNYCWHKLLKTTYYFRTKGASNIEKVTNFVPPASPEKNSCSIEAYQRGEICESCQ